MKGHFWYSKKQKEIGENFGENSATFAKINGKTVEYTQWISGKVKIKPNWDDAVYLGFGAIDANLVTEETLQVA
ncbi:MAG: hypothetical protein JEY94_09680 [Melioribacteraceae bacterium]|nr:hypothetical protein [Melioribacteraceae bacterium]